MEKREIKFRAWDEISGKMYLPLEGFHEGRYMLGGLTLSSHGVEYCSISWEDDDASDRTSGALRKNFTLMQFTGLKDSKGVSIYEGDVVKYDNGIDSVEWVDWIAGFSLSKHDRALSEFAPMEVIGNVYEHPSLLNNK